MSADVARVDVEFFKISDPEIKGLAIINSSLLVAEHLLILDRCLVFLESVDVNVGDPENRKLIVAPNF
jgi:hypothetical protein